MNRDQIIIRKYQTKDHTQVCKVFSDGILEHRLNAFLDCWKGKRPGTLAHHGGIVATGLFVATFCSFYLGISILFLYAGMCGWFFHHIYMLYVDFHLETDMKDKELSFWTTPPHCFIVATDKTGSNILGLVSMQKKSEDTMELNRLSVRADARGLGIGKKLVQAIIDEAKKTGFKKVYLDTSSVQQDGVRLYVRLGFEKIGEGEIPQPLPTILTRYFHGVYVEKFLYAI